MQEPRQIEQFPHVITEKLRFGDTDQQGHVNNAVFATLFESGRVAFLYDPERGMPPSGCQFVIAEITIRFAGEMNYPGEVRVASGVSRLGRTSVGLSQALFLDGRCVAMADSAIVLIDTHTRRPAALPDNARAALSSLMLAP
ncbi:MULTISPECIES: thioesterase family protein [unclassified Roseitalea]|uniref:acyl-CoA thioesterase n=1 Tax=unclassified Roseitalea TaxID=2639107 RepID=UPI00273F1C02|nr:MULTISPECIES: thioesterase family protein [unclassified Roseitalea]